MMEEEGTVIVGLLVGLNVLDANLCLKGEDLDSQVKLYSDAGCSFMLITGRYQVRKRQGQTALDQRAGQGCCVGAGKDPARVKKACGQATHRGKSCLCQTERKVSELKVETGHCWQAALEPGK